LYRPQQCFAWCLLISGLVIFGGQSVAAAEWGTLSGKFVYTGTPVKQTDPRIPEDQSLIIGPQGGIKNIFVFLKDRSFKQELIHPDYQKLPDQVVIQHQGDHIEPHTAGLWQPHQKLVVLNQTPHLHLTHLFPLKNHLPDSLHENRDRKKIIPFNHAELFPMLIKCDIHPWESSYLLVQNHPYFSITDETGAFQIKNLPVGEWEFRVWHERVGHLAAREDWERGRIKIQIKPGKNDLGMVKVSPKLFELKTVDKQ
jgi:hypothetical protein|tara:strand:+ start:9048 stop:9812 length:765 start_codon:yes stop_codon:yes gene_type:complete